MIADFAQVTNKSTGRTVTKVSDKQMPHSHSIFLYFLGRFCFLGRSIGTSRSLAVTFLPLRGVYGHSTKLEEEEPPVTIHQTCRVVEYLSLWGPIRESPIIALPIKCNFGLLVFHFFLSYRLWLPRMTRSSSLSSSRASTPSLIYLSRTFSLLSRNFILLVVTSTTK